VAYLLCFDEDDDEGTNFWWPLHHNYLLHQSPHHREDVDEEVVVAVLVVVLGAFGLRRSSKTGFNSIAGVQCVNRYLRTRVGIIAGEDQNHMKVDTAPKM
jgi:hypothetical protein